LFILIKDNIPSYWLNPNIFEFNLQVTSISKNRLTFSQPVPFFIEGGGQPSDKVKLSLPNFSEYFSVKSIISENELEIELPRSFSLNPPFSVKAIINKNFRQAVMRAHTCQHLLSALILKHYSIKSLKAVMQDDQGQLFLNKPLSSDAFANISLLINQFIVVNPVDVTSHILKKDSNLDQHGKHIDISKIRGSLPEADNIRILAIGSDIDLNTCGGTHISSTKEILSFSFMGVKKNELFFVCGLKGLALMSDQNAKLLEISQSTHQPLDKTLDFINSQLISTQKNIHESIPKTVNLIRSFFDLLYHKIAERQIKDKKIFLSSSSRKNSFPWRLWFELDKIILLIVCPFDKKIVSEASKYFSEVNLPVISFLLVDADILILNVSKPSEIKMYASDLANLFKEQFQNLKGGGNEFLAQLLLENIDSPFNEVELFINNHLLL
jgi:misacylated tRNA(Ala) deacylase